jgi:predicted tellurium resistance membrane protein TerC
MTDETPTRGARIRDRQVLLVAVGVVVFVLALRALSDYVPAVADALDSAPVLIVALIVVTGLVLVRALRPRKPAA